MGKSSINKNLLPNSIKLKGKKNYHIKKGNKGFNYYIYKKGKASKYIDKFNKKANKIKPVAWLI